MFQIRAACRADAQRMAVIEKNSKIFFWDEFDFLAEIAADDSFGIVTETGGLIVGHLFYVRERRTFTIQNITVDPDWRLQGVGRGMMQWLINTLGRRRGKISAVVRDTDLDTQLFFRAVGIHAKCVVRDYFLHPEPRDGYVFEHAVGTRSRVR